MAATFVEAPLELQKQQYVPYYSQENCLRQNLPIAGNAAGNTHDYTNLTGAVTSAPPLPLFTGSPPIVGALCSRSRGRSDATVACDGEDS